MENTLRFRNGYHNLLRREILELIPKTAASILDLGCGTGELGKAVKARQHCFYEGIELNKAAAEIASTHLDNVFQDNLNRFNPTQRNRRYDCIILGDILEHLINPWEILEKFSAVLSAEGSIIASIPNVAHPWIISQLQKGLFRYDDTGILDKTHLRFFTKTSIFQMFYKAGLKIVWLRSHPAKDNPIQYHIIAKKPKLKHREALVTVCILSYNTWPFTIRTIDSIKRFTTTPHKILVIDNGSTDGTIAYLRADKEVYHIESDHNLGFARGFNQALQCIDTPYFVLSNSDVVVTQDWLKTMLKHIDSDPKLVCLGPRSNSVSGPQLISETPYTNLEGMHKFAKTFKTPETSVITYYHRIVFFFTLFKSEVLKKTGFLDERFGIGNYEDDDYCMRIHSQGGKCAYDNTVFIHHYGSLTFQKNKINWQRLMKTNKEKFKKKWGIK